MTTEHLEILVGICSAAVYFFGMGVMHALVPAKWRGDGEPGAIFAALVWPVFVLAFAGTALVKRLSSPRTQLPKARALK